MKAVFTVLISLFFVIQVNAKEMTLMSGLEEGSDGYRATVKIVDIIGKKIDINFIIKTLPGKRIFHELETDNGKYDGTLVNLDGLEKKNSNIIKMTEPIIQSSVVAVSGKDIEINGWESLKSYKLANQLGVKIVEQNIQAFNLESHSLNTVEQGLKFVLKGRADMLITIPLIVRGELRKPEFKDNGLKILDPPVAVYNFHSYFFKQHADIAEKYNAALKELKESGDYQKIFQP